MLGHKNGLDGVYLQITTEKLFKEEVSIDFNGEHIKNPILSTEDQVLKIHNLKDYSDECQAVIKEMIPHLEYYIPMAS